MKKQTHLGRQHGFTLIELMIVVAIIGILAAVAVPKFAEMLRKSKEGATKGSLTNLRSALTIYISDNEGSAPMSFGGAVSSSELQVSYIPKYMDAWPTVKLGDFHSDDVDILVISTNWRTNSANTTDVSGWIFTTVSGSSWWLNCRHTDTKGTFFTTW